MLTKLSVMKIRVSALAACAALAGAFAASPAQAADITLSYSFFAPATTFPAKSMEHWAEQVRERTDGKVEVNTFPGGTLLGAGDTFDGVQNGVADIGLTVLTYDAGAYPVAAGMGLPLGLPDSKVASRIWWDVLQEFDAPGLKDFKIITAFTTEPSYIQSRKAISNADAVKGAKLRATGSSADALKALGAAPIGMPMSDVPQAIQTGVADGIFTSREVLRDLKLAEDLHYVTDFPGGVYVFAAVMSQNRWNQLPDDVKDVIDGLAEETMEWTADLHDTDVAEAMQWAQDEEGLELVQLDDGVKEDWNSKLQPLVEDWKQKASKTGIDAAAFLDRVEELKAKYISADD